MCAIGLKAQKKKKKDEVIFVSLLQNIIIFKYLNPTHLSTTYAFHPTPGPLVTLYIYLPN